MPNKILNLLSSEELLDIYSIPTLNDFERQNLFTFNEAELKQLHNFKNPQEATYFAICLVFFKRKQTLIDFTYRDVTLERNHVMKRYFLNKPIPKSHPEVHNKIRIQNKVLEVCDYQRFTGELRPQITQKLQDLAYRYPRQRQLCKELLNTLVKHHIAIPGYATLQDIVSKVWNHESKRLTQSYLRHTNKNQRQIILSLLEKTDHLHRIMSIKQDMKGFNAKELWREVAKQANLSPIFTISRSVLPQIGLPTATISYYASLVQYYDGAGLKQLNQNIVGLYLLCYSFTRYQALNDNLLDAFKKKTLDYKKKASESAKNEVANQFELTKEIRVQTSNLLIALKNHKPQTIQKKKLFAHIPEDQLLEVAHLLSDERFNKDFSFWKCIDSFEDSIKLNLRKLFLELYLTITNNDPLKEVIAYVKDYLKASPLETPCPASLKAWIGKHYRKYIISSGTLLPNRLEFLLYMRMVSQLKANKITLQNSLEYKKIEDELYSEQKWKKEKKSILTDLSYQKLLTPIQETLAAKKDSLTPLYKTVNETIEKGENPAIILKKDKKGNPGWRLSPLELLSEPNESLFAQFSQRSIIDILQFVENKIQFCRLFESILPKSSKVKPDINPIGAVTLANAIRIGSRKMSGICNLKESLLLTTEASYIRSETLCPVIDRINEKVAELPIFKEWRIQSILHGSLDGQKLEVIFKNIMARHSPKFFAEGTGVSAYNHIVNSLSVASRLIGSHKYEGHNSFEMVHHQNTSNIKPTQNSTDKHGMNSINFALFDLTDIIYSPRIPKPHREVLWGFGSPEDYEGFLIKPTRFADEDLMADEWDNIQRFMASLLLGECSPSTVIRKFCATEYSSRTKEALVQYNHLVRSEFILKFIHDEEFRRAILYALNRGEQYHGLYRAICLLNNGELRGKSETEMETWHQCTRFIAAVIHYYNAYIINSFYENSTDEEERKYLAGLSPTAWIHINLLGYYEFNPQVVLDWVEQILQQWDWKKDENFINHNSD